MPLLALCTLLHRRSLCPTVRGQLTPPRLDRWGWIGCAFASRRLAIEWCVQLTAMRHRPPQLSAAASHLGNVGVGGMWNTGGVWVQDQGIRSSE